MVDDRRAVIAAMFDRSAPTYDAVGVDFFSVFGRQLVEDAALSPGERVLDVGCGRGAVLFPAADRVGPGGSVTGIDISPGMVERTARDAQDRGVSQVQVKVMDAQEPALPPSCFDAVLSSLVVFFLPDPVAGLGAWRELLAPGGRLGLTTFAGDDERWSWLSELFKPYPTPGIVNVRPSDPDGPFASTTNLERLLGSLGYLSAHSVVREHITRFTDPEQWITWSWSQGQRLHWESVPLDARAEVRAQAIEHLRTLQDPDGTLALRQLIRYTIATR